MTTYTFEAKIVVTIPTRLGVMSYFHVYSDSNYERAKEYAEWQATLAARLMEFLIENKFQL